MILMESDMSIRRSARLSPRFRARSAALAGAMGGLLVLAGCGVTRTKEGATAAPAGDTIERTAEKGPVKLFVQRLAAPAAPVGSRGNGSPRRVPARHRDQTAGVRPGRGRLSHPRLQRAAP